jgi:hypothetical protein
MKEIFSLTHVRGFSPWLHALRQSVMAEGVGDGEASSLQGRQEVERKEETGNHV